MPGSILMSHQSAIGAQQKCRTEHWQERALSTCRDGLACANARRLALQRCIGTSQTKNTSLGSSAALLRTAHPPLSLANDKLLCGKQTQHHKIAETPGALQALSARRDGAARARGRGRQLRQQR